MQRGTLKDNRHMNDNGFLSETWLNGEYDNISGFKVTINTSLSFVCFEDVNDEDNAYVSQGDEADNVIKEINTIYNTNNVTVEEAIAKYINMYF